MREAERRKALTDVDERVAELTKAVETPGEFSAIVIHEALVRALVLIEEIQREREMDMAAMEKFIEAQLVDFKSAYKALCDRVGSSGWKAV